jgi:transcription antitermination factor NusG
MSAVRRKPPDWSLIGADLSQIGASVRLDDSPVRRHSGPVSQPEGNRPELCGRLQEQASPRTGRWICVQSHPQAERWALNNLLRSGYVAYLPMCAVMVRDRVIRSLLRERLTPLFAGYLFCALGPTEPWTPVRYSPGVSRLLGFDGTRPQFVPDAIVDALQAGEAARATLTPADASGRSRWRPGAAVRLSGGAFDGHDAVVLSVRQDTAVVGMVVFGQMREAIVGLTLLASRDAA